MGEAKIDDLEAERPREIRFIDPWKMVGWSLERCCEMVDNAISVKTLYRAIDNGELAAEKAGKAVTVEPEKFRVWYRRFRKSK